MNFILTIDYVHCNDMDSGCALHEENFESKSVSFPLGSLYPVHWMRTLDEFTHRSGFIEDLCKEVVDSNIIFEEVSTEDMIIERQIYDSHINNNVIECDQCYHATIGYFDKLYNEMLDHIRNSVLALMLCLKRLGIQKDMVVLLGKTSWNTRSDMEWVNLNPNQPKDF